ncbi:hypothetical protein B0T24DRAFT_291711 [Lasiosphaeria ovina]|uniref:Uncharacterized protein n=1 Tax=Lasiosphaeria ovina TaxID=92902 RepID=A0AAE0KCS1_9PEZI|nr:hypothetical protein B0T24DRAFT_291711 [Lasiosphaeria ovina]
MINITSQPANHGSIAPVPRIQLALMPQLAEARSRDEDWTGTNDAVLRRRAQTRLHTRAYRKRKMAAAVSSSSSSTGAREPSKTRPTPPASTVESDGAVVEVWNLKRQSVSLLPASHGRQIYDRRKPLFSSPVRENLQQHSNTTVFFFPLSADHLITLLQYNAVRALLVNRTLVSGALATDPSDCAAAAEPQAENENGMRVVPYPSRSGALPPSLLPTLLQQTVPHGRWIDLFPSPAGRDRLILAAGTFDADALWADCIGGLYEGFPDDEMERRGVIAWSPPWDMAGWEMSEGFVRRWGWLVKGVPDILDATNRWRKERGEEPLEV